MNKLLTVLATMITMFIAIAFFTISNESKAGIFDSIRDAVTGHVEDVKDRYLIDDEYVAGDKIKFSVADWSSDSVHYIDGAASIIRNDDGVFVQLEDDFKAGLAPDLYVYIAKGHIDTDAEFVNGTKLELGKLTKGSGASFYKIPSYLEGYSGEKFSVVIHCKRFNEPMGSFHFN